MTDQNAARFLVFLRDALPVFEAAQPTRDVELSDAEIQLLREKMDLVFQAAENEAFHQSTYADILAQGLEATNVVKAKRLLAEIAELPEEVSAAILKSLEGKYANTH